MTDRLGCWQVDQVPRTIYLDPSGSPVPSVGGADPWACGTSCVDGEGSSPPLLHIMRKKLSDPDRPDYADDPELVTSDHGRPSPDPWHLLKHASTFRPQVTGLPNAREVSIQTIERAMADVQVVVQDPKTKRRGLWHVVAVGGFRDFFGSGAEGGIVASRPCSSKSPRKERCSSTCQADAACRPTTLSIESLQPLDNPRKFAAAKETWPEHLVATAAGGQGAAWSVDDAYDFLDRVAGTARPSKRPRPTSRSRRATAGSTTQLRRIVAMKGVGDCRAVKVEGGRWLVIDLPPEAGDDPQGFLARQRSVEHDRGRVIGFSTRPAGA